MVTVIREAIDDIRRFKRDKEVNSKKYQRLTAHGLETIPSSDIHVGDIILVEKVTTGIIADLSDYTVCAGEHNLL